MRRSELGQGWRLLAAATLGAAIGPPTILFHTVGVFAPSLNAQFHWSIGQIQGGLAALAVAMLISGPLVGFLADRLGERRLSLVSLPLLGLTVMGFAGLNGDIVQFYALCAGVALFGAGSTPIVWTRGVNRWFVERRGLALGITLAGTGVFALVAKPAMALLIREEHWRVAWLALGAAPLVIWPFAYWGFRPSTSPAGRPVDPGPVADAPGLSIAQALCSWRFWLMLCSFAVASFSTAGPMPNMERLLLNHHFVLTQAVAVTSSVGLWIVVGRLIGGLLMDRLWAPLVATIMVLAPAVSALILARAHLSGGQAYVAAVLLGLGAGAEYDLLAFLVARYMGMRRYSSLYGLLFAVFTFVGGSAPAVYGAVFDRTGSYAPILFGSAAGVAVAAVSLLLLGRYPSFGAVKSERLAEPVPGPVAFESPRSSHEFV